MDYDMDYVKAVKQTQQNRCISCDEIVQRDKALRTLIQMGLNIADCYDEQVVLNKAMEVVVSAFNGRWCVLRLSDAA